MVSFGQFTVGITLLLLSSGCASAHGSSPIQTFCKNLPSLSGSWRPAVILNTTYVHPGTVELSNKTNINAFCRVFARMPYSQNDYTVFQVWLPDPTEYNERFLVVGNGGMAGIIDESSMLENINQGYAVAGGDSGHRASENNGGNGEPGVYLPYLHDPRQTLAWIHNSVASLTVPAKEIVARAYGEISKFSYYQGCSTGGAQGFALAQYHPHLFDGIIAGSPGNWYSHLALSFLWNSVEQNSSSYLPQEALDLISEATLDECDAVDGVSDRVIENPLLCHFDVSSLACQSDLEQGNSCLTPAQVKQAQKIYNGPREARSGPSLYPGFDLGSESGWLVQESNLADAFSIPILQNLVFNNLSYDATTFNWASDVRAVDQRAGTLIDEISPNLSQFRNHGGKMIVTQAWADPLNAATWPIQHLEQLEHSMGGRRRVAEWFSLFMVPGGGHCGGAPGYPHVPGNWHSLEALVDWVEKRVAPTQMLSTDPADGSGRTRKLCPWPKTAKYLGGDTDEWSSFECV